MTMMNAVAVDLPPTSRRRCRGRNAPRTREPSSGGMGMRLKMPSTTLTWKARKRMSKTTSPTDVRCRERLADELRMTAKMIGEDEVRDRARPAPTMAMPRCRFLK